jgi:HK97 family phage portal protein
MGLRQLGRRRDETRDGGDQTIPGYWSLPGGTWGLTADVYRQFGGGASALLNATSRACIGVLADGISRTPINAVRTVNGMSMTVDPMPRILANPSAIVSPDVWRYQLGYGLATDANAWGMIAQSDSAGRPTQIELLDAGDVNDRKVVDGVITARVAGKGLLKAYPHGPLWHVPGKMVAPGSPFGDSPVDAATKLIDTSLAALEYSQQFFASGGHPDMTLISDQAIDADQAADLKARWLAAHSPGTRGPAIMGSGLTPKPISIPATETQFLALIRQCTEEICRIWGVPPSMVFASITGQHMTYANVTQADLHFLKHALEGYFVRIEHALTNTLPGVDYSAPSVPNTQAVCDRNAILKADAMTRYQMYAVLIANRLATINEVRSWENWEPFDGDQYDQPVVPPFAPTMSPTTVVTPEEPVQPDVNTPVDSAPTA